MSGNTKELARSLVEMKISLGDLSMKEVVAFQGRDDQQQQGDAADPMNVDPKDVHESKGNPMKVDINPKVPEKDAAKNARDVVVQAKDVAVQAKDAVGQTGDPKEAIVEGKGDAQQA